MKPVQQRARQAQAQGLPQPQTDLTPPKIVGRPKGPPSTILNLRLPLDLLYRLDRYLDHLEVHTGLKANRGMIARRALELFLETHPTGESEPQTQGGQQ
jgi:hypothetical protein